MGGVWGSALRLGWCGGVGKNVLASNHLLKRQATSFRPRSLSCCVAVGLIFSTREEVFL